MKKRIAFLFLSAFIMILSGCDRGNGNLPWYSREKNFYRRNYEEEFACGGEELVIDKKMSRMVITASTSSGIFELTIYDKSKTETKEYPFVVNGYLSEEIVIERDCRDDEWGFTYRRYEDTEGKLKITVY